MKNNNLYWWCGISSFILLLFISAFISNANATLKEKSLFNEIAVADYLEMIKEDNLVYIYVGSSSCPVCQQIEPRLGDIIDEFKITINHLNLAAFSQNDYEDFINSHDILKGDWGTPLLLIFNEGELQDHLIGYLGYETLREFFLHNINQ